MRTHEVSYERVELACIELFKQGESISFSKIYSLIGNRGEHQVINDMIRRWRQETIARMLTEREQPLIPAPLIKASDALMSQMWKMALEHADTMHQNKANQLARYEADLQIKLATAQAYVDEISAENQELKTRLMYSERASQTLEQNYRELNQVHQLLQQRLDEAHKQQGAIDTRIDQLLAERTIERKQHEETIASLQERHTVAIRHEQQQASTDRKQLMLQLETLRQTYREQTDSLRQQLDGAHAKAISHEHQAQMAQEERNRQQNRADALQKELSELLLQAAQIRDEAARWQARAELMQQAQASLQDQASGLRGLMDYNRKDELKPGAA